jgi:hypothetical protein
LGVGGREVLRESNGRGWMDQTKVYSQQGHIENPLRLEHWLRY